MTGFVIVWDKEAYHLVTLVGSAVQVELVILRLEDEVVVKLIGVVIFGVQLVPHVPMLVLLFLVKRWLCVKMFIFDSLNTVRIVDLLESIFDGLLKLFFEHLFHHWVGKVHLLESVHHAHANWGLKVKIFLLK